MTSMRRKWAMRVPLRSSKARPPRVMVTVGIPWDAGGFDRSSPMDARQESSHEHQRNARSLKMRAAVGPWQTIRAAARALARHKGRTLLTTLGIVIGIAAVIAMIAVGEGAKIKLAESFNNMGTNMLVLRSGASHYGGVHG